MLLLLKLAFARRRSLVVLIVIASLAAAGIEGLGLSLILPIVEGIGRSSVEEPTHPISRAVFEILASVGIPTNTTSIVLLGLSLFAVQSALLFAKTVTNIAIRVGIETSLRSELFASLIGASVAYFDDQRLGRLSNAIVVETTRVGSAVLQLLNAVVSALLVAAYVVVAFLVSWQLTLISIAVLGLLSPVVLSTRRLRMRGRQITAANAALESTTVEYLSAAREVSALGLQRHANDLFGRVARTLGREIVLMEQAIASFKTIYEIAAVAIVAALLAIGAMLLDVPTAAIVTFFALLFRLAPRLVLLQTNVNQYAAASPGYEEVQRLHDEVRAHPGPTPGSIGVPSFNRAIAVEDVRFSYDGGRTYALDGVSFEIKCGSTVGIVGGSGAGKSTLVDLLLRFADPDSGRISVDGVDLREVSVDAWRRTIGFVGQETFLFHDTIANNLRLGNPSATRDEVAAAATAAGAHEFIDALPHAYDTVIGDRGVMLSGGQRQRLALARALVRDPRILLLDEATSDLDARSQAAFQEALRSMRGERTVVLIAHRLSTIRDADVIVVLEQGRVVESGTHDALLRSGGYYANYYATEAGDRAHRPKPSPGGSISSAAAGEG